MVFNWMMRYTIVTLSVQVGQTALHRAAQCGYTRVVQLLMRADADPNLQDEVKYMMIVMN